MGGLSWRNKSCTIDRPRFLAESAAAGASGIPRGFPRMALYVLLGFSAGLPFYMFSTVLSVRLADHGVALAVIGFFAWVQLLPTFKFLWAPLLDKYDVPGFARFFGKRRGWIMLSQLGIFSSMLAMALFPTDTSLPLTALFAVLLAFWTTTLEVAADAWRIELAPTPEEQGPVAASNLWGYRTAMVAAGSGALLIADQPGWGWTGAYLAIAATAFIPFPILASMRPDPGTYLKPAGKVSTTPSCVSVTGMVLVTVRVATTPFASVGTPATPATTSRSSSWVTATREASSPARPSCSCWAMPPVACSPPATA